MDRNFYSTNNWIKNFNSLTPTSEPASDLNCDFVDKSICDNFENIVFEQQNRENDLTLWESAQIEIDCGEKVNLTTLTSGEKWSNLNSNEESGYRSRSVDEKSVDNNCTDENDEDFGEFLSEAKVGL